MRGVLVRLAAAASVTVCVSTALVSAQTTATTAETKTFEVIAVDGNQLVVKLPEGTREISVPPGFMFNVDGKQVSVNALKPGMTGTATITTTTTSTPVTVTEVKSGTVRHASGNTIIVQTDEGFKQFTQADVDKRGVKIYRAGKPADISSFREGDRLSATIVSHLPPSVVTQQQVDATLAQAPSRAPAATTAAASGTASATGASATGGTARTLPKTGSVQPLIGLVGLASLSVAWGLAALRRRRER